MLFADDDELLLGSLFESFDELLLESEDPLVEEELVGEEPLPRLNVEK